MADDSGKKFVCEICNVSFIKINHLHRHNYTQKHRQNCQFYEVTIGDDTVESNTHKVEFNNYDANSPDSENSDSEHENEEESTDDENELEAPINDSNNDPSWDTEWFPFKNKLCLLLYGLLHSATHNVSLEVANYFWFILKEIGVSDLPTIKYIRNLKFGNLDFENLIKKGEDENGTPVYLLKPTEIVKLQIANPKISNYISRYPNLKENISEQCDGTRFHELSFPWARNEHKGYCLGDFVQLADENFSVGVIQNFLEDEKTTSTMASVHTYFVKEKDDKCCLFKSQGKIVPLSSVAPWNMTKELQFFEESSSGEWTISHEIYCRTNPLLGKSDQHQILNVPINIFLDDTSTNVSRRWLPLHCVQMQLAGLPVNRRSKGECSHFIGASENVPMMTISKLVVDEIVHSQRYPSSGYDAKHGIEIKVSIQVASIIGDFNMLALVANHNGATTEKFCPKCHTNKENCLTFQSSRVPSETRRTIARLNLGSTEKFKKALRKKTGVKEFSNHWWDTINPHRDVPSGVLHLFHLGVTKHLMTACLASMNENSQKCLGLHLAALDDEQLISFDISKHLQSRQGKDLKKLIQCAPHSFHFTSLNSVYLKMVCMLALLHRLVHAKEFTKQDLKNVDELVFKYFYLIERNAPELKKKVKTHLLIHLTDEIIRHGPPQGFSEDAFEKRHGQIRAKLFSQENQLARSRDTARIFAKNYIFQHLIMGGFFLCNNGWVQSSSNVQDMINVPGFSKFMGIEVQKKSSKLFKLCRENNKCIVKDAEKFYSQALLLQGQIDMNITSPDISGQMLNYSSCRGNNGTTIHENMAVLYYSREKEYEIGMFKQGIILLQKKRRLSFIIVTKGTITEPSRHSLGCPIVTFADEEDIVPLKNLISYVPLVHDCIKMKCKVVEKRSKSRIEQENKNLVKKLLLHNTRSPNVNFVNVYSLKCPQLCRYTDYSSVIKYIV